MTLSMILNNWVETGIIASLFCIVLTIALSVRDYYQNRW